MKRSFIILFFSVFFTYARAQNAAIDSINRLMSTAKTDTAKINLASEKVRLLGETNIDSSLIMAKKTLEEAKRINYKKGEADVSVNLATDLTRKGDYASAKQYLANAEAICSLLNDSSRFSRVYSGYGMLYGMQALYDTSIRYYRKSISIDERLGNKKSLGTSYGNLAIGYQMQSNFPQTLFYQQKSLQIAEELNNMSGQAYTLMNMGNTYLNIGDTARSEKAFLKGIDLAKSVGIKNVELYGYSNLAPLYSRLNDWHKSFAYAMKAADLAKKMGDAAIQASSLAKAASALSYLKRWGEATALAKQAIAIADSAAQAYNIYQAYSTMGFILKEQEKYAQAIPFFEKGVAVLKKSDIYNEEIGNTYSDLSLCYEKTGSFSQALAFYKTSAKIADSIHSKENIRKATELSMNYEFDKKQEARLLEQKNKDAVTHARQSALVTVFAFTLILAIIAFSAYSHKQKANKLLTQQKEALQKALTQLKTTQTQLIQSEKMASLGELTAGIAHEIQNPLNFVKNFSEVSGELVDEMKEELKPDNKESLVTLTGDLKENLEKITHHSKRADAIVKGMLQHSRASTGKKELTDINALADEYLRLSYHGLRAKDKTFNSAIQTDFNESLGKINVVQQDMGRVLLNLFNNAFYAVNDKKKALALKGENYEPTVWVTTRHVSSPRSGGAGVIEICIRDNGNGIPQKILDKIYQPFFTTKPSGQGTGLGLSLSYDIIKAHDGVLKVETKEGEGAEFIIQLPIV